MPAVAEGKIVTCAVCRQMNRVAPHPAGKKPVCGACGAELPEPGPEPVKVTDATFQSEVMQSSIPVLLDLWAPWCGPCRMIAPIIEQLAGEYAGKLKVAKLNVDENPQTASLLGVQGIPALKLVKDGRLADEMVGAAPKEQIVRWLAPHLQ